LNLAPRISRDACFMLAEAGYTEAESATLPGGAVLDAPP
jgi:hypothetical protein